MKNRSLALPILGWLTGLCLLQAQPAATLKGVVTDPTGAVCQGAEVAAQHLPSGTVHRATTGNVGQYQLLGLQPGAYEVKVSLAGFKIMLQRVELLAAQTRELPFVLELGAVMETVEVRAVAPVLGTSSSSLSMSNGSARPNTEEYGIVQEEGFANARRKPLSTFSIDVDTAAYTQVRRHLREGGLPPADAVRIEELINFFQYSYPNPTGPHPFSVTTELAACPWNSQHRIVHVGLKSKPIPTAELPPASLTFLIDVSGSMSDENKLPLLKKSFALLVDQLRPQDRVAIAVYAGAAGLVLPPTPGSQKTAILAALDRLEAGGSTAGAAGLRLAYETARANRVAEGNNRVVLATDGDFNVGVSSDAELQRLIEEEREHGVYLTVLGYGMGNVKDGKMEMLARHGNGNYAYIDNLGEARRVLVQQLGATLNTVAKDVKLQVEFNPAQVKAYRLIGYENRRLKDEDFKNDRKDAGDLGAGHSVTALYEIVPADAPENPDNLDPLKYQRTGGPRRLSSEVMTVKFRYKPPQQRKSIEFVHVLKSGVREASPDLRFALAVSEFGLLLRGSPHKAAASYDRAAANASAALGADEDGRRAEFLSLVKQARGLAGQ